MPRYRKKPIVVEAFQMTREARLSRAWPEWVEKAWARYDSCSISIGFSDYIIRGPDGDLCTCSHEEFEATYEVVGEGNEPLFHDLGPVRPMPRIDVAGSGDEGPAASFAAALDSPAIQAACRSMWSGVDWDVVFAECPPLEGED